MGLGFLLEEGQPYTAPVWVGEFGYGNEGVYWANFVKYLSDRDVDWAYWALNGKKYGEGYLSTGHGGVFLKWAACDSDVRYMEGTNCEGQLGSWGYADRDPIFDLVLKE